MNKTLLTVLSLGLGGIAVVSPAEAGTSDVSVTADTYVSASARSASYDDAARLRVDGRPDTQQHTLLQVPVPSTPDGEAVDRVQLRLLPAGSSARGVTVYSTDSSWDASTVTWQTMPAQRELVGSSDRLVAGTVEVIDLDTTAVVPGSVLGLRIETTAQQSIGIYSSQSARGGPSLRVETSPAGTTPELPIPGLPTPTIPGLPIPTPTPDPAGAFPPVGPVSPKLIGMSAPASLWSQRIGEVGADGVTARRIFADLTSSGGGQMNLVREAIADGMMPVISYKVPDVATMVAGGYDSWLAELRRQLTALDADVTATFWHEPHGDMEPAQFRAASLKFFEAVDAPNVAVGPILNGWLLDRRLADFAAYTDAQLLDKWEFVAVDSYQSGEPSAPGTSMPARAIPLLATWMDSVGHPDKPLGLGEYNGFSAEALAGAGETILSTPEMWFGIAWNSQGDSYAPLAGDRITAFQATKADPRTRQ